MCYCWRNIYITRNESLIGTMVKVLDMEVVCTSFKNHFPVNGPEDEPEPEPLPKAEPLPEREPAFKNAPATGKSLKKRDLEFCLKRTRFDEKTVLFWFRSFRCF